MRPYDEGRRPSGLAQSEGFYLDLLTEAHDGQHRSSTQDGQAYVSGAPAYYVRTPIEIDGRRGVELAYWLLFGSSALEGDGGFETAQHEGDWVRIDIVLEEDGRGNRFRPRRVRYHQPDGIQTVDWEDVELARGAGDDTIRATHPVAYSGRYGHDLYPRPGKARYAVVVYGRRVMAVDRAVGLCSECARWETWRSLRAARDEPWFGYGGGWGLAQSGSETSGPLGPMPQRKPSPGGRT